MNTEKQIIDRMKKRMDELEERMYNVVSLLETLENSLFFADERTDKDMTKASARSAKVIAELASECLSDVYDLKYKLDKLAAEPEV